MKKLVILLVLAASNLAKAQVPAYVPQSGLQGFWPFSGNANDVTANSYASTNFGAQLTTDRFGGLNSAYYFDGISNYIVSSYAGVQGNAPRAVSFWAKKVDNSTCTGVAWGGNNLGDRFDCLFNYAGDGASVDCAYAAITYSGASSPNDNVWHHYVYNYSGTMLSDVAIYMDGIALTSTVSTYNPSTLLNTTNDYSVTFGRVFFPPNLFMYGALDEIGIWNRTLTTCEIKSLYLSSTNAIPQLTTTAPATVCLGQAVNYSVVGATNYTWTGGGNGPSKSYIASNTTTLSVSATNTTSGCSGTFTATIKTKSCVGINENTNDAVKVWPNPANSFLNITTTSESITVKFFDATGKLVAIKTPLGGQIDISDLSSGLYMLELETEQQPASTQKLVVLSD